MGGADGRGAADSRAPPVGAASTSGFDTTPPRPVPLTAAMSIPRSSAMRRAAGDDLVVELCPVGGEAAAGIALRAVVGVEIGDGVGAFPAAVAPCVAPAAAGTAVSSSSPRMSSTCTTSPSFFARLASTPGFNAGTSTVILSVSSSTSVSPAATASPSFFCQRETVASTMDSPSGGTFMGSIQSDPERM